MKQFVYFLMVTLAFTALHVGTVEASHDQAHVDEMRATEDSARETMRATEDQTRQTMRATEDQTRQTMRDAEDSVLQAARDAEDSALQAAREAMNTAADGGDGGPDCEAMGAPGSAARTACEVGEGGHHDCSEIPDAAGRALCETAEARGTPPTAAECALVGDPAECLRHAAGGGGGDCSSYKGSERDTCLENIRNEQNSGGSCSDLEEGTQEYDNCRAQQ